MDKRTSPIAWARAALAALFTAGCGTSPGSSPASTAASTAAITPTTLTAPPPVRMTTSGRPPSPGTSPACPARGTLIEPAGSCEQVMGPGEVITVHLASPCPRLAAWRIDQVQGTSARVGPVTITGDGSARSTLTAVRPGMTSVMATVPGPHSAPGKSLTLTALVWP